jgi:RimJ/RimL family protein N-acetyltransferase
MEGEIPLVGTKLSLRWPVLADAARIFELAANPNVLDRVALPSPYELHHAEAWLASLPGLRAEGKEFHWAIVPHGSDELVGAVGLMLSPANEWAEVGYWIGEPYWGQGIGLEAARLACRFGFDEVGLNRLMIRVRKDNEASKRIALRLGFQFEGCLRQHMKRAGQLHDLETYGLLRSDERVF